MRKVFNMPLGLVEEATEQPTLMHQVQEPARTVDIVPGLQQNSLFSISKFADANYIIIFTPGEVKICDGNKMTLSSTNEAILQEWRDPVCGLWCIQLHSMITNTTPQHQKDTNNRMEVIFTAPPAQKTPHTMYTNC